MRHLLMLLVPVHMLCDDWEGLFRVLDGVCT